MDGAGYMACVEGIAFANVEYDQVEPARLDATRELALEEVWGGEGEASLNVVDRYVAYLRRKLGDLVDTTERIKTIRNVGYLFSPAHW